MRGVSPRRRGPGMFVGLEGVEPGVLEDALGFVAEQRTEAAAHPSHAHDLRAAFALLCRAGLTEPSRGDRPERHRMIAPDHPDDLDHVWRDFTDSVESGTGHYASEYRVKAGGGWRWPRPDQPWACTRTRSRLVAPPASASAAARPRAMAGTWAGCAAHRP